MSLENMNENIRLHLIKLRKNIGLSQADVAAKSEVLGLGKLLDQNAVVRIEKQPLGVDFIKLTAYLSALGISIESFYELLYRYAYQDDNPIKIRLRDDPTLKSMLDMICQVKPLLETLPQRNQEMLHLPIFDLIQQSAIKIKPMIGFFGMSHVGKSTLINMLIGQSLLPTSMLANSHINTLLMHVDDKPAHLIGSVAVFKKGFHQFSIFDEKTAQDYLIAQGDKSILLQLGHPQTPDNIYHEAYLSVVFTEADVLKHIWLLDTAGDLENRNVAEMVASGAEWSDGVVFMSDSHNFLKPNEWGLMANILRLKPTTPASHWLIVPSQCDCETDIDTVQKTAVDTLTGIQEKFGSSLADSDYTQQLITRIQPFGREHQTLRNQTLLSIQELAKYLIPLKEKHVADLIQYEITQLHTNLIHIYELLTVAETQKNDKQNAMNDLNNKITKASALIRERFHHLLDQFDSKKREDLKTIKDYFDRTTSQDGLTDVLNGIYSENEDSKVAQTEIGNCIGQLLIANITQVFNARLEEIYNEINLLLNEWDSLIGKNHTYSRPVNLSTIGVFDRYCSPENTGANHHAIILANSIGFITYRYVGGSWQSNLAKKTANVIRNGDIWKKVEAMVLHFWDNTEQATNYQLEVLLASGEDMMFSEKYKGTLNILNYETLEKDMPIVQKAIELLGRG